MPKIVTISRNGETIDVELPTDKIQLEALAMFGLRMRVLDRVAFDKNMTLEEAVRICAKWGWDMPKRKA